MRFACLSAALLAPAVLGAAEKGDSGSTSPALALLPEGSTLKSISIPRYDKEMRPAALLRAGLMRVVTEKHVFGENVELRVFEPDGSVRMQINMGTADYFTDTGRLEATETLTVDGQGIKARGSGAIFQLNSRRGFVYGPITATIQERPKSTAMKSSPTTIALLGAAGLSLAAPPEALTPQELAEFEERGRPAAYFLAADAGPTKRDLIRTDQIAQYSDLAFRTFAHEVGRPGLLTIATNEPAPAAPPKELANDTQITCDGGMFFDSEKSQVVFLKNVVVKQPGFTLSAGGELKIFLEKKPVEPPKEGEAADEDKEDKPALDSIGSFSDISTIVATGGVKLVRKDEKGEDLTATADTATFDAKSGDMVLRGGFPRVQQGRNFVRALESGLYVRIYASGKGFFEEGRWETSLADVKKK